MNDQSAGAILRILNLIAHADGNLDLEEEKLLTSLAEQYQLQARLISWEDKLESPNSITALVGLIDPEQRSLTLKTAQMVARVSRQPDQETHVCEAEQRLLQELQGALNLPDAELHQAIAEAEEELLQQPSLWQVLYGCFGNRFSWPLFPA